MGAIGHDGLAVPGKVVLAHETAFAIGRLRVHPPTRQLELAGRSETIEPRVMQVLVALARANGAIVSRDDLIAWCWEGRIVSDDAINRVLSRLRQLAAAHGNGFRIETITKVGYRLVETGAGPNALSSPPSELRPAAPGAMSRRGIIAGAGLAAASLGAAGLIWTRPWRHRPPAEAEQLYRRGSLLVREALPGQIRQSVSYFERAVAIDPQYADAWGALALTYSHLLQGYDPAEMDSLPRRIRAAARRSLDLDPDNADAQLALIFITPFYGNWVAKEADLRRIVADHPRHWLAKGRLAVLLYQVGRLSEGIELHRSALKIEPMLPVPYYFMIKSLSALGRAQEAEALIDQAWRRWPAHPMLWSAKFDHLLYSGRPKSATAFIMDPASLPSGFGPPAVERRLRLARALDTRSPADIEATIDDYRKLALADVEAIASTAPIFAALGRPDLTFASLERYYFNRGSFGAPVPPGRIYQPVTNFLFDLPMAGARRDERFSQLLRETKIDAYWRETRSVPDYRRG
jgi:DNA-binding winged helix-turn-helix (wHTH) protein/tetratricopeptide (TPR) repeat protein